MKIDNSAEQLPFIDGVFTPNEASEILSSMMDGAMNFCSIKQLSEWEKNHHSDLSCYANMKAEFDLRRMKIEQQIKTINPNEQNVNIKLHLTLQVTNK